MHRKKGKTLVNVAEAACVHSRWSGYMNNCHMRTYVTEDACWDHGHLGVTCERKMKTNNEERKKILSNFSNFKHVQRSLKLQVPPPKMWRGKERDPPKIGVRQSDVVVLPLFLLGGAAFLPRCSLRSPLLGRV